MSTKKSNASLREKYDGIYRDGEEKYFSKFIDGVQASEVEEVVLGMMDWNGKTVLDVGCGTGGLVRRIAGMGASHVTGIDYASEAIRLASESPENPHNVEFVNLDLKDMREGAYDVVVSCGTMEHSDNPSKFLASLCALSKDSPSIVITCPHFINLRGFTWMALVNLLGVPMSLTDIHFIHPWQMDEWANENGLRVEATATFDHGRGNGAWMVEDLRKRLTNALRDAGLDNSRVENHLEYLTNLALHLEARQGNLLEGATAAYLLSGAKAD